MAIMTVKTMTENCASSKKLSKNQSLVMGILDGAKTPLSAYAILDALREQGLKAPLQVYRALDALLGLGLIHRLESLNAFVACQSNVCDGTHHSHISFAICDDCGHVQELNNDAITHAIDTITTQANFTPTQTTIEIKGLCKTCQVS